MKRLENAVWWADQCWGYWGDLGRALENVDNEEIETFKPSWWLRAVRNRLRWHNERNDGH